MRQTILSENQKKIGEVSNARDLVAMLSDAMKSTGEFKENQYDVKQASEAKAANDSLFQTKANEVIHTGNTGFGAELIQGAITTTDFLDMAPEADPGLSFFQGFHGRNMNKTTVVPAIGELGLHSVAAEWTGTTSAGPAGQLGIPTGRLPTNKVQINQAKYRFSVDVSDEESQFSIVNVIPLVQNKIANSAARTILAAFINGDTLLTTANINTSGLAPAAITPTEMPFYVGGNGLRKAAIAAGVQSIGALTFDKFVGTTFPLGMNGVVPQDLAYFVDVGTYNKARVITEFKDRAVNGLASTVINGAISNVAGSDMFINRYVPKSAATGIVDGLTPANNAFGSILAVHKYAIQYGFSGEYNLEIFRIPGEGWRVLGYYYMGHTVADSLTGMPTDANRMVSMGANVTIV